MATLGSARLAWQSDYGQFYLVDLGDADFTPPITITPEMERSRFKTTPAGLVVYTADCLQQHLEIRVHDAPPESSDVESMSQRPWTQVQTTLAHFPSRTFTISSPCSPDPQPFGPLFLTPTEAVHVRISWVEFEGTRVDSVPIEPDVIQLDLWPAA